MSEQTLLDIKSDYIFKLVFGDEKHKRILISLLNAILKGDPKVGDLKILNPEIPKILKKGKSVRLDVKADIGEEKYIDIEIQVAGRLEAADRAVQYLAHLMTEKSKTKKYLKEVLPEDATIDYSYPKVIGIWIFAENVTTQKSAVNKAQMTFEKNELDDYAIMTKKAQIVFIELPKFNPKKADRRDLLNAWLTFLRNPADEAAHEVSEIEEAYEALKHVSADGKVRRTYQAIIDKENDIESAKVNAVKAAKAEGRAEGMAEGRAEGRAEGEKIGEARGIEKERAKAHQEKIETAKRFLAMGLSVEQVILGTGLSIDEVKSLA